MVKLEFKTIDDLDYKNNMLGFLCVPLVPQYGWKATELREVLPLRAKIDEAEDEIILTPEEHAILVKRFENGYFKDDSQATLDMINYICTGEPA